jgi:hypothetical protein
MFLLESSYCFQAGSIFVKITWGSVKNCEQRPNVWSPFVEWKSKVNFIDEMVDIALFATQIPLSIFTNFFHQWFEKHSMLESMLDILQQFYIKKETEPDDFHLFPGDLFTYTWRCIRYGQSVALAGLIGETLLHAPNAMLYHWNMIQSNEEGNHRDSILMPLLFTSFDNYLQSLNLFKKVWTGWRI